MGDVGILFCAAVISPFRNLFIRIFRLCAPKCNAQPASTLALSPACATRYIGRSNFQGSNKNGRPTTLEPGCAAGGRGGVGGVYAQSRPGFHIGDTLPGFRLFLNGAVRKVSDLRRHGADTTQPRTLPVGKPWGEN